MSQPAQDPPPGWPPAEVDITPGLVHDLLIEQHPDLAGQRLRRLGNGWDNVTFRLGTDLAVRLPRRQLAVELIGNEQKWLPHLADQLPVPIPAPFRIGEPGSGYPWPWSVVPWFDGVVAAVEPLRLDQAAEVGRFLRALHRPAPPEAPHNPFRGVPLEPRSAVLASRLERIDPSQLPVEPSAIRDLWADVHTVPIDVPAAWLHGDLHPRNVIVTGGKMAAVVDWGDICVGDPATDLAAAWMQFPAEAHDEFWAAYGGVSEATWKRARGWAISFGLMLVDSGHDDASWAETGKLILERACS